MNASSLHSINDERLPPFIFLFEGGEVDRMQEKGAEGLCLFDEVVNRLDRALDTSLDVLRTGGIAPNDARRGGYRIEAFVGIGNEPEIEFIAENVGGRRDQEPIDPHGGERDRMS